ncbi:fungal-specific transcription factor domain-containing protein [Mycena maculata]|uniref:Fungal-specific transcription factor domain-containing protein n=1 Tax=Mycena maculata TaxID=230809 RepID=A0AAD7IP06_9AGAR|nr:fungal-specific transcription factor domain-containing protein [Mycena maculata]
MSSNPEPQSPEQLHTLVKKKQPRPCDMCRRRKRRCDGGERCSHCIIHHLRCTYVEPAAVREIFAGDNRAMNLKLRLDAAEAALQENHTPLTKRNIKRLVEPFLSPHPGDSDFNDIADSFRALSLEGAPPDPGFQGKSSTAMLVTAAVAEKTRAKGSQTPVGNRNRSEPKPWTLRPCEQDLPIPHYVFPEEDLMVNLVTLYFSNVNAFIPLLHRPTFWECIKVGLYMRHNGCASILLLICAVGSLYLTDPGLSGEDRESLGWKYYNQVELCGHTLRQQPTLYDLQVYCLAAEFLHCTSNPRTCWSIVGFGLRLAQDIGAHRQKVPGSQATMEEELERRAVWILFLLDTEISAALGRLAYFDPGEIDIGHPVECDDEYWIDMGPGRQLEGKPSGVAFFNCVINLDRILSFTLRSLYRSKPDLMRVGITTLAPVALDLDAALDKWLSSIPAHLVWDPDRTNSLFATQSAALHCFFYYTRILVHRPFLPTMHPTSQTGLATQKICGDAARACIRVAETNLKRHPDVPLLFSQSPLFTAAMVLLLETWDTKTACADATQHLRYIHAAIRVLKSQQPRWQSSAFLTEVLERLLSTGGSSMPRTRGAPGQFPSLSSRPESDAHLHAFAIPPVFVGDEEISVRFHQPHNFP